MGGGQTWIVENGEEWRVWGRRGWEQVVGSGERLQGSGGEFTGGSGEEGEILREGGERCGSDCGVSYGMVGRAAVREKDVGVWKMTLIRGETSYDTNGV